MRSCLVAWQTSGRCPMGQSQPAPSRKANWVFSLRSPWLQPMRCHRPWTHGRQLPRVVRQARAAASGRWGLCQHARRCWQQCEFQQQRRRSGRLGAASPVGRRCRRRAAPCAVVLSTVARWRRWAVPAVRLVLFPALPWLPPLDVAPSCVAVDAARVVVGELLFACCCALCWAAVRLRSGQKNAIHCGMAWYASCSHYAACFHKRVFACTCLPAPRVCAAHLARSRTFRLLFFGLALPLDLPAHLAVHTLCLALALAGAPRACTLPVRARGAHGGGTGRQDSCCDGRALLWRGPCG